MTIGTTASPAFRKLGGFLCLLIAVGMLAVVVYMTGERFGAETTVVHGVIDRAGTEVHLGQPRVAAINAASVYITLEERLADSREQPVFGRQPSVWPTGEAEEIANRLEPGMRVAITVDEVKFDAAVRYLEERERDQLSGGGYTPPLFGPNGEVWIFALEADGETVIDTSDGIFSFVLTAAFCLLAVVTFGAVGIALLRGETA